jgi:hypothetical protein
VFRSNYTGHKANDAVDRVLYKKTSFSNLFVLVLLKLQSFGNRQGICRQNEGQQFTSRHLNLRARMLGQKPWHCSGLVHL